MRLLLDTDVLLDVALRRPRFFEESAAVMAWAEAHPGSVAVAWHSLSNLHYLVRPDPRDFIRELLTFTEVPRVGHADFVAALGFPMPDLEDAMQAAAALAFGAGLIVTRNVADFRRSPVMACLPREALRRVRDRA